MPYIKLPEGVPGITGPMQAYPETAVYLRGLVNALLQGPSSLTPAEREIIATSVSHGNECKFCTWSHAAIARAHLGASANVVDDVLSGRAETALSPKMNVLLTIAEKVRQDGRLVTADDVAKARAAGADDKAIHDTVLIAAAFCMFNRYVDGLGTWAPDEESKYYASIGEMLAKDGYRYIPVEQLEGLR
ncbi:MAG: peroxidase-related enzyme [Planctomycetaceae bacterium]